jgi:hypothetical protein
MNYENLSKEIFNLDSKIRFVRVCDEPGGQQEGVKNLLSPEESKKSNLQAMLDGVYVIRLLLRSVGQKRNGRVCKNKTANVSLRCRLCICHLDKQ